MGNQARVVTESRIDVWAGRLARLSHLARIVLALAIAVELTVLLSVAVDRLLIDSVVDGEVDPRTPALIAAVFGVILYGIGWWAMIGFDGDPGQPWKPGVPAVLYTAAGAAGLVILVVLALFGLAFGYLL
jgi:hypothetical protein